MWTALKALWPVPSDSFEKLRSSQCFVSKHPWRGRLPRITISGDLEGDYVVLWQRGKVLGVAPEQRSYPRSWSWADERHSPATVGGRAG